jgi:hypothetical protein
MFVRMYSIIEVFCAAFSQKSGRGQGRAALVAARRQRNSPSAMLSARGEGGEKSDSFSRGNEQDRSPLWKPTCKGALKNVPVEHFGRNKYLLLSITHPPQWEGE